MIMGCPRKIPSRWVGGRLRTLKFITLPLEIPDKTNVKKGNETNKMNERNEMKASSLEIP